MLNSHFHLATKKIINFIIVLFSSCNVDNNDIVGKYIKIKNDVKEVMLLTEKNIYYREIYDLNNGKSLLKLKGTYFLNGNCISFNNFYTSYNAIKLHKKYLNSDNLMNTCLNINKDIFFSVYIEETEYGEVVSTYYKQN